MKISKLFHWLYAFLMLLPVFFIGGRCLYVTFNKNAKDSYYGETINEYENVQVNSGNFNYNRDYLLSNVYADFSTYGGYLYVENFDISDRGGLNDYVFNILKTNKDTIKRMNLRISNSRPNISFSTQANPDANYTYLVDLNIDDIAIIFQFNIDSTTNNAQNNCYFRQYNDYSYLDNAFIYSVNSLNDTPLFSWAKTSFLVAPFSYISGLFGIASTNPINTMLSYWLAISIIWLVFDLIMYVPLLVHRWIDKAKLE